MQFTLPGHVPSSRFSKNKQTDNAAGDYVEYLIEAEQKSQESYDKTVLALSGGGLGLSITGSTQICGVKSATAAFHENL